MGLAQLMESWDPGVTVIVYCSTTGCASSRIIAERLREEYGLPEVYWLRGGWEALREAGGP
mgnify:CR=1 FL=1